MLKVPLHLREHIAEQRYDLYTDIDHASWRYIMRVSKKFFVKYAHKKYIDGLVQTGITTEHIPRIVDMDKKLKKFGWRAVTVTGFIPPAVFLEFQSLGILPIACDMRRLEHLEYTPAPDIVHEAAGHAPIIADPNYASYLKKFGEIASQVIFAKEDLEVYEAIKHLSEIKENPNVSENEISASYAKLNDAYAKVKYVSEAAQLSRLGWWTTEYGLVKTKNKKEFRIYGAGLLSSVGESYDAIMGKVKKVRLTINCINVDYDITKPQPQLFYVEKFTELKKIIDQFAKSTAFKMGGLRSLERAKVAQTVTTATLDSGLQISGVLKNYLTKNKKAIYLQYSGPTQLSFQGKELAGHSAKYHREGFGSPLGKIKKLKKSAAFLSKTDLKKLGFEKNKIGTLVFESGVVVQGKLKNVVKVRPAKIRSVKIRSAKMRQPTTEKLNLILTFTDCKVLYGDQILFEPAWGTFDMACGESVPSVHGAAADRGAYLESLELPKNLPKTQSSNLSPEHEELLPLYEKLRGLREQNKNPREALVQVVSVVKVLDEKFKNDWLLRVEIVELLEKNRKAVTELNNDAQLLLKFKELIEKINIDLIRIGSQSATLKNLIKRGLDLVFIS